MKIRPLIALILVAFGLLATEDVFAASFQDCVSLGIRKLYRGLIAGINYPEVPLLALMSVEQFFGPQGVRKYYLVRDGTGKWVWSSKFRPQLGSRDHDNARRVQENQQFSFDVMQRRGVISEQDRKRYEKISESIEPGRILDVRISAVPRQDWWDHILSTVPPGALDWYREPEGSGPVTHLRSVSGQIPLRANGRLLPEGFLQRPLPWMVEFPELAQQKMNRTRAKFAYEWSRAATVGGPESIRENLRLLALLTGREVQLLGGKLEDTVIYLHANNLVNAKLYEGTYGFHETGRPPGHPNDVVVERSLKELIDELEPHKNFIDLEGLGSRLGLTVPKTLELLDQASALSTQTLNLADSRTHQSIARLEVDDRSFLLQARWNQVLSTFGVTSETAAANLGPFLPTQESFGPAYTPWTDGRTVYLNLGDPVPNVPDDLQAERVRDWFGGLLRYYRTELRKAGFQDPDAEIRKLSFVASTLGPVKGVDIFEKAGFSLNPSDAGQSWQRRWISGSQLLGGFSGSADASSAGAAQAVELGDGEGLNRLLRLLPLREGLGR